MVRTCKTCSRRTDRATVMKCSLGIDGDPGVDLEHGCYWYEGAEAPLLACRILRSSISGGAKIDSSSSHPGGRSGPLCHP